jgi:hypothetical protein
VSEEDNLANTLNLKKRRLWSLKRSIDFSNTHEISVTDSGMLVRIRSRMFFDLVGNGLTCSRKKSCIRSRNCIELDERVWEALSQFQLNPEN